MLNSKWFKRSEISCKCGCGFNSFDAELLTVLEDVREYFDKPVTITSGNRCEQHNNKVGGSKGSKHKLGTAADILVKGTHPSRVYEYLNDKYPDTYGIGDSTIFTHIDVRETAARWKY